MTNFHYIKKFALILITSKTQDICKTYGFFKNFSMYKDSFKISPALLNSTVNDLQRPSISLIHLHLKYTYHM